MNTPCKTEDDCPTPTWCRGKNRCPKRDAQEKADDRLAGTPCSLLVVVERDGLNSRIQIKVAHQSFALEYQSDEPGAMEWFAGQVRSALAKAGTNVAENAIAMAPPPQRLPSTKDVPGG